MYYVDIISLIYIFEFVYMSLVYTYIYVYRFDVFSLFIYIKFILVIKYTLILCCIFIYIIF